MAAERNKTKLVFAGAIVVALALFPALAGAGKPPGDPKAGLKVFKEACAGCHNFQAAGIKAPGKPGTDLDARKPTFSQIVKLIVQGGGGGADSERILRKLSWEQIYDVAAFISLNAGKGVGPPPPPSLQLHLLARPRTPGPVQQLNGSLAPTSGRFSATLTGRTLRWHLSFGHLPGGAAMAQLHLGGRGKTGPAIKRLCGPCTSPAKGRTKLSRPQAKAMRLGKTYLTVVPGEQADNALRGQIVLTDAQP